MAAYPSGSNVQAESIQTLHLMNPGYSGCADASNAGNLILLNHPEAAISQSNSAGNSGQQQHPYTGYPMPPMLAHHSSLAQQSTLAAMYTSQQSSSGMIASRMGGNSPYTWATTNELSFLPSNEAAQLNQSLAARFTSMTSEPQLGSNLSHFNMGRQSIHDEQVSMLHKGMALGLNVAHAHDSDRGSNRGLSLSLSPEQHPIQMQYYGSMQSDEPAAMPGLTHVTGNGSGYKPDRMPNLGNLSHFRTLSMEGELGTSLHNYMNDMSSRHTHAQTEVPLMVMGSGGFSTGSKYLKAVQHLLKEVVSVEGAIRKNGSSSIKHVKPQSCMAHNSLADSSVMKGMAETGMTAKVGMVWGLSTAASMSCPDMSASADVELTPQARQELQMKKAKLMAMLEEVDRRYKLYHSQMQAVVSSFESAAGLGAGKPYTALALQTISRHFRCLRDAIASQIRVSGRGLGEEEHSCQHRALQQLQMMQQHAWRPQRGLPERAVSVLRAWLFEHFLHPYPKDADKILLAKQTGLTRSQVSNWFINARVRLWKPMVEEMYQEEAKELETPANQRTDDTGEEGDDLRAGLAAQRNPYSNSTQTSEQDRIEDGSSDEGERETRLHQLARITENSAAGEAMIATDPRLLLHERQGGKKARISVESFVAKTEVYSDVHDLKDEYDNKEDSRLSFATTRGIEGQGFGAYLSDAGAMRGGVTVLGSNAVSLTLGLQHSDVLEAQHQHQQHQQQHYFHHLQEPGHSHGHGNSHSHIHGHDGVHHVSQQLAGRLLERRHGDLVTAADVTTVQDYYSSMAVTNSSSNSYQVQSQLQNRKRLAGHNLHHDFTS